MARIYGKTHRCSTKKNHFVENLVLNRYENMIRNHIISQKNKLDKLS
jgi:hypothetical protein